MDDPAVTPTSTAATPPASPAAAAPPRRLWRNDEIRARRGRRRSRAAGLAGALVVAGGLLALVGWLRPIGRPALIVAGGPARGFGSIPQWDGDRRALAALATFDSSPGTAIPVSEVVAAVGADSHAGPLVVYVCARGWIEGSGPGDGRPSLRLSAPDGPPLADLIRTLRERPAARKLLVLDIHPPPDDPRAGAVLADVAAVIADEAREAVAAGGGLSILASCEAGQRPQASDALGRSAFGYYVEQGLKGAADASGDGRVTARELAAFARERVGRWARRVRDAAQSPTFHEGPAADEFPLAVAPRRLPPPADLPKDARAYPAWLAGAWGERDAALAGGLGREAPRLLGQFEAALLLAEREWRDGLDEAAAREALADRLGPIRERIGPTRAFPHPSPRSLAMEEALGASPDPEILRATREVVARRPRPGPDAKPGEREAAIAAFHDPAKLKLRSDFDLAHAAFRVAVEDPSPDRDAIVFLDRLLAIRLPKPSYVETDAIRRLAGRTAGEWDPKLVHRTLLLTRDGERAQSRPAALLDGTGPLDGADRLRHEAEFLLGAPGYATAAEVDRRLAEAQAATDAALAGATSADQARRLADEAMALLPPAATLLDASPELERPWSIAADAARSVLDRLGEPPAGDGTRPVNDLHDRVEALRSALAPFAAPAIAARVARLTRPEPGPGPSETREIDALLATPLPAAVGRPALWKAGIEAERRLVAATIRLDGRDGRAVRGEGGAGAGTGETAIDRLASGPTPRRIRASERLLAVGGLAPEPAEGPLAKGRSNASRWAGVVEAAGGRPAFARDRAARLAPPWLPAPSIDDPATDPTRARRAEEFAGLRRWLAARYAFEAGEAGGQGFFAEAARDFEEQGDPPVESARIDAGPAAPVLDPEHPDAIVRIGLQAVAARAAARARVEVAAADGSWLGLGPGSPWPGDRREASGPGSGSGPGPFRFPMMIGPEPVEVPVRVALRTELAPKSSPVPPGLIVRARLGSRTSHRLIPLRVEPESRRPRLILTADPAGKGPDTAEVRLRAARGKTPFYLAVRNPGDRDRTFTVDLLDGPRPIEGATASVAVKAGGASRVIFGPPAAKPDEGFVEIRGPLSIRLTDPDDPAGAIVRKIPAGLASPSNYARISARFEPAGPKNGDRSRLEVTARAVGPIDGPPCPIDLSLSPDRIPGLVSIGEGTYTGKLARLDDESVMTIEGVEVDARGSGPGFIDLAVDGIERAFVLRARLDRREGVVTPVLETRPEIRIRVGASGPSSGPLPVAVNLDSPPEGGRVEVEVGQHLAGGGFRVNASAGSDSGRGRVRLNPRGTEGALVFEASVRDPSVVLPIGRIRGRRLVRARLRDERGVVRDEDEVAIVLDDRAPGRVELVDVPKYGLKGGTVTLRATGSAPDSGLKEVVFFVGRPVDGKRPPNAAVVPGRAVNEGRTTWTAALPMGEAKLGPLEVSVEFVAGVGIGRFDTATIAVVEAIPAEPAKIRGTVAEGSRPQPGFEVRVLDEKGAEKAKAKTDDSGRFEVAGLPPGNYVVVCVKPTPPTRGSARVALKPGETAEVAVPMYRAR